jgi:hypothetical protein
MLRLVRNLALGAALITVAVAVWRDYGVLITLKRAIVAYLATFFLAGGLGLIAVFALKAYQQPPPAEEEPDRRKRGRNARRRAPTGRPDPAEDTPDANAAKQPATPASEPVAATTES